jgi:predicted nucleic-acid-binding protein
VKVVVDTNVLVRHFTHDDAVLGRRATSFIERAAPGDLVLTDVVVAELVVVLERYHKQNRSAVTEAVRSLVSAPQVSTLDAQTLSRAVDLYEDRRAFVDAYALAVAEREGCGLASFDRRIARRTEIPRVEP